MNCSHSLHPLVSTPCYATSKWCTSKTFMICICINNGFIELSMIYFRHTSNMYLFMFQWKFSRSFSVMYQRDLWVIRLYFYEDLLICLFFEYSPRKFIRESNVSFDTAMLVSQKLNILYIYIYLNFTYILSIVLINWAIFSPKMFVFVINCSVICSF